MTVPGEETIIVEGFRPFTNYSCMIVASNSQGSGPPARVTRRTDEDGECDSETDKIVLWAPDLVMSITFWGTGCPPGFKKVSLG